MVHVGEVAAVQGLVVSVTLALVAVKVAAVQLVGQGEGLAIGSFVCDSLVFILEVVSVTADLDLLCAHGGWGSVLESLDLVWGGLDVFHENLDVTSDDLFFLVVMDDCVGDGWVFLESTFNWEWLKFALWTISVDEVGVVGFDSVGNSVFLAVWLDSELFLRALETADLVGGAALVSVFSSHADGWKVVFVNDQTEVASLFAILNVAVAHNILLVAGVGGTTGAGILDSVGSGEVVQSLFWSGDVTAIASHEWGVLALEFDSL